MATLSAPQIAELSGLRQIDPANPLARKLIDEQIATGQAPDRIFYARLQVAWRDGRMTEEELLFCRRMRLDPLIYVKLRRGKTFKEILAKTFDMDVKRLHTGGRKPQEGEGDVLTTH